MTEAIPELLPCPFCGGDSICHEVQGNIRNPAEFYVTCVLQTCCGYHSESEGIWRSENVAVEAWNRRDCSIASVKPVGEWRGTFRWFTDCQSVGQFLVCSDFEMKINGEWFPIDWIRFRASHPDDASQICGLVKDQKRSA